MNVIIFFVKKKPEMPIQWKTDENGRHSPTTEGDILVNKFVNLLFVLID